MYWLNFSQLLIEPDFFRGAPPTEAEGRAGGGKPKQTKVWSAVFLGHMLLGSSSIQPLHGCEHAQHAEAECSFLTENVLCTNQQIRAPGAGELWEVSHCDVIQTASLKQTPFLRLWFFRTRDSPRRRWLETNEEKFWTFVSAGSWTQRSKRSGPFTSCSEMSLVLSKQRVSLRKKIKPGTFRSWM